MEIKGCEKQILTFLRTLGAKSLYAACVAGVQNYRKKRCASPAADFPSFSCTLYTKTRFFQTFFLVNKGCPLYKSVRYTRTIMVNLSNHNNVVICEEFSVLLMLIFQFTITHWPTFLDLFIIHQRNEK